MQALKFCLLAVACVITQAATANPQLAKDNKCFTCHTVDKRVLGPSFKEIAEKYRGQAGAKAMLVERLRKTSVGVWGTTPMQAFPDVPQKDLENIMEWILNR